MDGLEAPPAGSIRRGQHDLRAGRCWTANLQNHSIPPNLGKVQPFLTSPIWQHCPSPQIYPTLTPPVLEMSFGSRLAVLWGFRVVLGGPRAVLGSPWGGPWGSQGVIGDPCSVLGKGLGMPKDQWTRQSTLQRLILNKKSEQKDSLQPRSPVRASTQILQGYKYV